MGFRERFLIALRDIEERVPTSLLRSLRSLSLLEGAINLMSPPSFSHSAAQKYEKAFATRVIKSDFLRLYIQRENLRDSLWHNENDEWFQGDKELFARFVAHNKTRNCLEIGSGPFGYLAFCDWIRDRIIIDPLISHYRDMQIKLFGRTFFTPDIKTYASAAESLISELCGKIDGFIMCRNALDHCEDPLRIIYNMTEYAAPGCYLVLWTDIWHERLNEGHRNITHEPRVLTALIEGLGFIIINSCRSVRNSDKFLEYGVLARKR